jgi:hypothetical protein
MKHADGAFIRIWDTTAEHELTVIGPPCERRLVLERVDGIILDLPPDLLRHLQPGTVVILDASFDGVPMVKKPALVLHIGSFTPEGQPIIDVLADPEYL